MEVKEYGDSTKRKLILIHGFQLPLQIWESYISRYKSDFHIILPVITGHSLTQKADFVSLADTASELEDYYISQHGDKAFAVYGMSMGGALVAQLLQNQRIYFEKIVFDGSPLVPSNFVVRKFMHGFYSNITKKAQGRDDKTLRQATKRVIPEMYLDNFLQVLDNMSDATVKNAVDSITSFRLSDSIDLNGTELYYFHGTSLNEMLAKKSARYLSEHYPDTVIKSFKGKGHCENALHYPDIMIKELDAIFYR